MDDRYKRLNSATGEPFQAGYQDETGRIFLRYLNKQGNDGYYLEEWKKDINSFIKKADELNISYDLNQQLNQKFQDILHRIRKILPPHL